jgi:ABC-type nitrate/sulfonate/bicarbonate transport system ATPase subunit
MATAGLSSAPGERVEVDIVGVSKAYGRGSDVVHALDEINLSVAHNEFVSVLGPSGCGKSTLLLLVAGLLSPSEGSIILQGRRVDGPRRTNGIVFQDAVMLPGARSSTTSSSPST